ncbi:flagellar protein FlaG [Shewanella sp. 125m-1]
MDVNVTNNALGAMAVDITLNAHKDSQNKLGGLTIDTLIEEVNATEKSNKSKDSSQGESIVQMESVVTELSDMMSMLRKGLAFKIDESLGQQVVSVLDIDTGDLIRQIPNEEALELAIKLHEKIAEMDGLLMSTQV